MASSDDPSRLVLQTAKLSLFLQVVFTGITAASIPLTVPSGHEMLQTIAVLETVAQVVEFTWYGLAVFYFSGIRTWTRYIDWYISTPTMLISTLAFLVYLKRRKDVSIEEGYGRIGDLFEHPNAGPVGAILTCNFVMLSFGLAVERGFSATVGLLLGTLSFVASFLLIFGYFVVGVGPLGFGLYMFMFTVWGLYGVAATLSETRKNVMYNGLDIVSKNFYGTFVFAYTLTVST